MPQLQLREFIDGCNDIINELNGKIDDIKTLVNVDYAPDDYLKYLAALIGADLSAFNPVNATEYRRFIRNAVKWYKLKGLYGAITVILYIKSIRAVIYDMWTSDYVNFIRQDPSIDIPPVSTAYKTPHFGLEIVLDTIYGTNPTEYLLDAAMFNPVLQLVEEVRPVHTVPHYGAFLHPVTDQSGNVMTVSGRIATKVTPNWNFVSLFFDMWALGSLNQWYFDNGKYFDWSYDAAINNITKWKLGIGNRNTSPAAPTFALADIVLTGDVDVIRNLPDRIQYEIILDESVVQAGLSELGLFLSDNTTMMIASTFPIIDKISGTYLRIMVEVLK